MGTHRLNSMCSAEIVSEATKFIALDQTMVVFDVEQPRNAQQTLTLRRLPGVGPVGWRFQTNAPTRYIVSPNGGVLVDDNLVKVVITLVSNRYSPQHKMQVHAMQYTGKLSLNQMWKNTRNMQVEHLEMGTTLMNVDHTAHLSDESTSRTDLRQILDLSSTIGAERVKELEDLYSLSEQDNATLVSNTEQTGRLKEVLKAQLNSKRELTAELRIRVSSIESSYMRKSAEVDRLASELEALQSKQTASNANTHQLCSIS